jgi:hypothetical protein
VLTDGLIALRLRPPVPLNSRFCRRTNTLPRGGGEDGRSQLLIREGDAVAYAPYHMHRHTDIYGSDAPHFRPERWEDSKLSDIKWVLLPFNGGLRICLGSRSSPGTVSLATFAHSADIVWAEDFGTMLASYGIISVIQSFPNIELAPEENPDSTVEEPQDVSLVLSTPDGYKVVLNTVNRCRGSCKLHGFGGQEYGGLDQLSNGSYNFPWAISLVTVILV